MSLKHIITSLRLPCHSSIHYRCIALFQDTGSNGSWSIPRRSGHGGHYNCSTFCACGDHLWHPCCVAFLKFQLFQCAMVGTTIFSEISWTFVGQSLTGPITWTTSMRYWFNYHGIRSSITTTTRPLCMTQARKVVTSLRSGRPHSSTRCCRHVNFDCEYCERKRKTGKELNPLKSYRNVYYVGVEHNIGNLSISLR